MSGGTIGIVGTGRAMGSRLQTNAELCSTTLKGTTPEWIVDRTGIRQRFLIGQGETLSGLSLAAAREALARAGVTAADISMIVVGTFSADYLFPAVSARLHRDLGAKGGQFYDLQANCTGFVSALTAVSDRMARDEHMDFALVLGAEVQSPFVDPADVQTAIFLSDGAGAAVVGRVGPGHGIVSSAFFSDTSNYETVRLRGGGSSYPYAGRSGGQGPEAGHMEMNGIATWKQVVTNLPPTIREACRRAGWSTDEVDLFVFHQANYEIIGYLMAKMRLPMSRTFTNVERVGNAGAASLPIALADADSAGALEDGARVVLAGMGAGFGFGATCLVWGGRA